MWKQLLSSLNGKILIVSTAIYLISIVVAAIVDKHLVIFGTLSYLFLNIWSWISNTRSGIVFLSWFFRKFRAVELISFDDTRYYTLAKYESYNKMSAPVYFGNNIGQVILLEDGTTDPESDSRYIKYWLPLNKNDRALQILRYGITT